MNTSSIGVGNVITTYPSLNVSASLINGKYMVKARIEHRIILIIQAKLGCQLIRCSEKIISAIPFMPLLFNESTSGIFTHRTMR